MLGARHMLCASSGVPGIRHGTRSEIARGPPLSGSCAGDAGSTGGAGNAGSTCAITSSGK